MQQDLVYINPQFTPFGMELLRHVEDVEKRVYRAVELLQQHNTRAISAEEKDELSELLIELIHAIYDYDVNDFDINSLAGLDINELATLLFETFKKHQQCEVNKNED